LKEWLSFPAIQCKYDTTQILMAVNHPVRAYDA